MARYIAERDTWLSSECRLIKAGTEFDAEFPEGMKLSDNLREIVPEGKKGKAASKDAADVA